MTIGGASRESLRCQCAGNARTFRPADQTSQAEEAQLYVAATYEQTGYSFPTPVRSNRYRSRELPRARGRDGLAGLVGLDADTLPHRRHHQREGSIDTLGPSPNASGHPS